MEGSSKEMGASFGELLEVLVHDIINNGTSNKTIDLDWYNTSLATKIHIMTLQSVSSKTFLQLTDPRIVLNAGDYIEATSETGSSMTVMFTVELSQAPQVQYHAN